MIASNAGQDGGIVCEKVIESKGNHGYNALTDVYERHGQGRCDRPNQVTHSSGKTAASSQHLLLTSDALIAEKPKAEKGGKGTGHGGDYDMY